MTTTTNLGMTLIDQAQAQKEVTINEALNCLDALVGSTAADKDLTAPPGSPTPGVVYIIATASPTGAWAGHANAIAYFDQVWRFITPQTGAQFWLRDESKFYQFNGTAWQLSATVAVAGGGTGQTSYTDGQLLIGNSTGNTLTKSTLTAGSGISITNGGGSISIAATATSSGDVVGPASATDTAIARFNTATGKLIQNSGVLMDGSNNITGAGSIASGAHIITSSSASAFEVGPSGATNSALEVDCSTASSATGLRIKSAAAAGGVSLIATSSGANESLTLSSKGSANLTLTTGANSNAVILAINSSARINMQNTQVAFTPATRSGTAAGEFVFTGSAGTTLTASTEAPIVDWNMANTQSHATGALLLQRDFRVRNTSHLAVAASTLTDAATFAVDGAPVASTNASITNGSTIYSAGVAVGSGTTNSYGLNIAANTGATNNYAARFAGSGGELFRVRTDGQLALLATNTASGTTGAQTINKPSGTVNFAAGATSLVVTNSLVTTASIVMAVIRTADATATIKNVVPAAGSFTINLGAAATAETSVGFMVIN